MGEGGGVILSAPSWFSLNNSETVKDMKLGPVTKLDQRNTTTSKDFDDDVIWTNCDVIIFFRFMVNLHPSGRVILETQAQK